MLLQMVLPKCLVAVLALVFATSTVPLSRVIVMHLLMFVQVTDAGETFVTSTALDVTVMPLVFWGCLG